MMKSFLLACAGIVGLSSASFAADVPSRQDPAAPVAPPVVNPAPVSSWEGLYAGVNLGASVRDGGRLTLTSPAPTRFYTSKSGSQWGFTGGAHVGYNFQTGPYVYGVETDLQYSHFDKKRFATPLGTVVSSSSSNTYFGTARGRLGYSFGDAMVYGTGGLAYGDIGNVYGSNSTRIGYTLGVGAEYQVMPSWVLRAEYLYVGMDRKRETVGTTNGLLGVARGANDISVIRTGLSYKF